MFPNRKFRTTTVLFLGLTALAFNSAVLAQTEVANNAQKDELWRKGSTQALANDFSGAARTFDQLVKIDPQDISSREALEWAQSAITLSKERESARQKSYDQHLDVAKLAMEKKKWGEAIKHVQAAREYALDPADVRKLPWLDDLVTHTKEKIADYRAKGSWVDALILYEVLARIYEDTPKADEYTEEAKFCQQRAHFSVSYKKDGEWKRRMVDIQKDMVREVFRRVSREYVRQPNFKEMTLSGIKYLLLLAQMNHSPTSTGTPGAEITDQAKPVLPQAKADKESLVDVFPSLGDEDLVSDFVRCLEAERDRIAKMNDMTWDEAVKHFDRILNINATSLKLPEAVVVHEFLDGAMTPLDDFTSIIWPSEVSEFNKHTKGSFAGVGIQITKDEGGESGGYIRVETPLEDTPAFEAGISPGDIIMSVDGKSTKNIDLNDAVRMITGDIGSPVTLTIKRPPAEGTTDIKLKRREIKLTSVKGYSRVQETDGEKNNWEYLIDPKYKIGYVRLSQFTESTPGELKSALRQIRQEGGKGLILDLRSNPGGLLTSAIGVCELFLDKGEGIVRTKGRTQEPGERNAQTTGTFSDKPIIILVNEQSASASEIVAGALSGNHKACIVGERSFGKGSVQNLYPLDDNKAQFKITTAKYYVTTDPQGENWRCVHKEPKAKEWGVDPNIKVQITPSEYRKVYELRRKQDMLKGRNQKELPKEMFEKKKPIPAASQSSTQPADDLPTVEDDAPDRDPQLETAVAVMRVKIVSGEDWPAGSAVAGTDGAATNKARPDRGG